MPISRSRFAETDFKASVAAVVVGGADFKASEILFAQID